MQGHDRLPGAWVAFLRAGLDLLDHVPEQLQQQLGGRVLRLDSDQRGVRFALTTPVIGRGLPPPR
jgi:hypothetical protein